jgi:hypothetical protein
MAKCEKCDTTENIVRSGVDALLLGIPGAETEKICYPCANADRAKKLKEIEIPPA